MRSIYAKGVLLLAGSACGWFLFAPPKPTTSIEHAFLEIRDGGDDTEYTVVVKVTNSGTKQCTIWKCFMKCACGGSADGLPLELAPGQDGYVLLHVDVPPDLRYCQLSLLSDAPEIDGCTWDTHQAIKIYSATPEVDGPIPDPMFTTDSMRKTE